MLLFTKYKCTWPTGYRCQYVISRCITCQDVFQQQGCQPVFTKKSQTLSQKNPDCSFTAYTHEICITEHKIDIKTCQNHRYNKIPLFKTIFFHRNYIVTHLFLINSIDHFQGNSKIFSIFYASCMVIDSFQKRMNTQLRQCFSRAKSCRPKKSQKKPDFVWLFLICKKSQRCSKKSRISKSGFKKAKLATLFNSLVQQNACHHIIK